MAMAMAMAMVANSVIAVVHVNRTTGLAPLASSWVSQFKRERTAAYGRSGGEPLACSDCGPRNVELVLDTMRNVLEQPA